MFDGIRITNERLITVAGLSIVGLLLNQTDLAKYLNLSYLKDNAAPHIKNSDVALSYIGLLCQGKSDFDLIREMDSDPDFYCKALGIRDIPSSETLSQRFDMVEGRWHNIILIENRKMLKAAKVSLTPCLNEYIPLDVDVSPFDNSRTKKQGVARTYKGFDEYAPIFAYIGAEGYLINTELRQGSDHCQKNTVPFLETSLKLAKSLTKQPLLLRMDAGNDSGDNIRLSLKPETACDFLIKRNLRSEAPEMWLDIAKEEKSMISHPRDGKTVYTGSVYWRIEGCNQPIRIVYRVIERISLADGQMLLVPVIEAETWWTSLSLPEEQVIGLYNDHGTCEQFHSGIKTDMDLERLPSGKFETNSLILILAILAYNILRIMGQESVKQNDSPMRKDVKRRRIRTVIQDLVLIATRVVTLYISKCNLCLGNLTKDQVRVTGVIT